MAPSNKPDELTGLEERMLAIETESLTRTYPSGNGQRDIVALGGVSLSVEQGEVRGLLGPNGAGKTTLEGRTILLTTHDMAEAEALCDRVTLIDHGKVLAVETPTRLSQYVARYERIDFEGGHEALLECLHKQEGVAAVTRAALGHRIELSDETAQRSVLSLLVETGITSIRTSRPSLEEVYVHLIGDRGLKV